MRPGGLHGFFSPPFEPSADFAALTEDRPIIFNLGGGKMTRIARALMVAALPMAAFGLTPSAAMAQSYTGSWPVHVALPPQFADTACLKLVEDGTAAPHGGSASLSGPMVGDTTDVGTFIIINHLLVVTIQAQSDTGSNAGLVFIIPASDGDLGKGVYENVYGGEDLLSGGLTLGAKGDC
jgi:hypothetical protein